MNTVYTNIKLRFELAEAIINKNYFLDSFPNESYTILKNKTNHFPLKEQQFENPFDLY